MEEKKIELVVREIDVAKFERGGQYLILLHPAGFTGNDTVRLETVIEKRFGVTALCVLTDPNYVKIYEIPNE